MKTILITGINGYLGSKLAIALSNSFEIVGLEYNCENLYRIKDYSFKVYDCKHGIPNELFGENKIEIIVHTATFYGRNNESDTEVFHSNFLLPQILLNTALLNSCNYFINTDTALDRHTSIYSLSKKMFLDYLIYYSQIKKVKVVNLKLDHFYGPGSSDTNFITLMVKKMLNNEKKIKLTLGEQSRDFLYVSDLINAFEKIINKLDKFSEFTEFEVGSGNSIKIKTILQKIKSFCKSQSYLDFGAIPYRKNEIMNSNNNIDNLISLGWSQKVPIEDGINEVIDFEIKIKKS